MTVAFFKIECNNDFFDLFDNLYNDERKSGPGNEAEYYCNRKYVIGKQLVPYEIDANPKKIDVLGIRCDVVM